MSEAPAASFAGLRDLDASFWMYTFKVATCPVTEPHDPSSCPFAHPFEKHRRRHPLRHLSEHCQFVRAKKVCPAGDACPYSHTLYEHWLHPDRFRTSICSKGTCCDRPVCFFAHTQEELRPGPPGLGSQDCPAAYAPPSSATANSIPALSAMAPSRLDLLPTLQPTSLPASSGPSQLFLSAAAPAQADQLRGMLASSNLYSSNAAGGGSSGTGGSPQMLPGHLQYGQVAMGPAAAGTAGLVSANMKILPGAAINTSLSQVMSVPWGPMNNQASSNGMGLWACSYGPAAATALTAVEMPANLAALPSGFYGQQVPGATEAWPPAPQAVAQLLGDEPALTEPTSAAGVGFPTAIASAAMCSQLGLLTAAPSMGSQQRQMEWMVAELQNPALQHGAAGPGTRQNPGFLPAGAPPGPVPGQVDMQTLLNVLAAGSNPGELKVPAAQMVHQAQYAQS